MKIYQIKLLNLIWLDLGINLTNFVTHNLLYFVLPLLFWVGGGWVVRKIKNKDQLSPAVAEIGAELGNTKIQKQLNAK